MRRVSKVHEEAVFYQSVWLLVPALQSYTVLHMSANEEHRPCVFPSQEHLPKGICGPAEDDLYSNLADVLRGEELERPGGALEKGTSQVDRGGKPQLCDDLWHA